MTRETTFLAVTPQMRIKIATTIESLIALLDEIDGDENLEPTLGWSGGYHPGSQAGIAAGSDSPDECEDENEHGGDINDEPHDWNELEADPAEWDAPGTIMGGQGV